MNGHGFNFKFYAVHPAIQSSVNPTETSVINGNDEGALAKLGADGWEIVGMCINPKYSDQLLIALQRAGAPRRNGS